MLTCQSLQALVSLGQALYSWGKVIDAIVLSSGQAHTAAADDEAATVGAAVVVSAPAGSQQGAGAGVGEGAGVEEGLLPRAALLPAVVVLALAAGKLATGNKCGPHPQLWWRPCASFSFGRI